MSAPLSPLMQIRQNLDQLQGYAGQAERAGFAEKVRIVQQAVPLCSTLLEQMFTQIVRQEAVLANLVRQREVEEGLSHGEEI